MIPTVGVVLVNYNGLADTRECLHSLAQIRSSRWFPVVVDNASSENSMAIEAEFLGCPVIRQSVNRGWAGGNNVGIRHCLDRQADYIILLNNDTRVDPLLIDRLVRAVDAHHGFGILGPVIRNFDPPYDIQTEGCTFNAPERPEFFQRRPVPLKVCDIPAVTEVDIVNGCCLMLSSAVIRKIGLIDERFFLVHEESDYCLRARRAGFRCGIIGEALVWHKGSQSFRRAGLRTQRYYDSRNLFLLLSKHGYLPGPRRGLMNSLWRYLKYAYARYEYERDAGIEDSAQAVLEGVCDALQRRFGAYRARRRPGMRLLRTLFDWRRRSRRSVAGVGA